MYRHLDCRCGWSVMAGLDCTFCGREAAELEADAVLIAEVLELRSA